MLIWGYESGGGIAESTEDTMTFNGLHFENVEGGGRGIIRDKGTCNMTQRSLKKLPEIIRGPAAKGRQGKLHVLVPRLYIGGLSTIHKIVPPSSCRRFRSIQLGDWIHQSESDKFSGQPRFMGNFGNGYSRAGVCDIWR
ncbi:hypothetical protein CFAM422_008209 [Trichoderma lentiforme]|uniref:Uncharacterized protein n=1 Tax=Trichoderma lentiforme TaxID=1567552 RepID=A0A9P4XCU6_9HYPO|nr:hypothetical protein CFAM422_008209 [Trichoderma lentiforme]